MPTPLPRQRVQLMSGYFFVIRGLDPRIHVGGTGEIQTEKRGWPGLGPRLSGSFALDKVHGIDSTAE